MGRGAQFAYNPRPDTSSRLSEAADQFKIMRLVDVSYRLSSRFQRPARSPRQVAREAREILLHNARRLAEYNLRAAHEHVYDLERRLRLAQQASGPADLVRMQVQRLPESGLRISADLLRNMDIGRQTWRDLRRLLRSELRKQLIQERRLPAPVSRITGRLTTQQAG